MLTQFPYNVTGPQASTISADEYQDNVLQFWELLYEMHRVKIIDLNWEHILVP